jgi:hypothetical protein
MTTLKPGDKFTITDYHGIMCFEGTYIGIFRDVANMLTDNIMVFSYKPKGNDAPPIRYVGCVTATNINKGYGGEPDSFRTHLVAHYYGNSIETLVHVSREQKPRKWEKR